jgi:hypothetical protein
MFGSLVPGDRGVAGRAARERSADPEDRPAPEVPNSLDRRMLIIEVFSADSV